MNPDTTGNAGVERAPFPASAFYGGCVDGSFTNGGWSFADAHESTANGSRAVSVTFDPRGTKLLGELTTHWCDLASQRKDIPHARARLAIIMENKIIAPPKLGGPLTNGLVMITGSGEDGLSEEEVKQLINAMVPPTTEPSAAANPNTAGN